MKESTRSVLIIMLSSASIFSGLEGSLVYFGGLQLFLQSWNFGLILLFLCVLALAYLSRDEHGRK